MIIAICAYCMHYGNLEEQPQQSKFQYCSHASTEVF